MIVGAVSGGSLLALSLGHQNIEAQAMKLPEKELNPSISLQGEIPCKMEEFVKRVQKNVTKAIEDVEGPEGKKFFLDNWTRHEGGGYGCSAVLQDGKEFEKAGVNYTILASPAPKGMLNQMRARKPMGLKDDATYDMFVAGVSMVIHPHNPMAPTFHANYR